MTLLTSLQNNLGLGAAGTDQFAVVPFTTPASPGTLDITSPDITETFSAAILIFGKETTDDSNTSAMAMGVGFIGASGGAGDSTQQVCVTSQMEDGVTTGQDGNTVRDPSLSLEIASNTAATSPTVVISASYDSSISGGVRLSFSTTAKQAKGVAILFAGLAKAATGQCTFNEISGSHEDVGTGGDLFEPDLVIFRSSDNITNGDTPNATAAIGFATNRSPISQVSAYVNWDELAATSDSDGYIRSDSCSSAFQGDRVVIMDRFAVTSFDSTGFNAIASDSGTGTQSPQANYLALKFTDADTPLYVGNHAIAGSTGDQSFSTGFQPAVVFGMSSLMTSVDSLIDGSTASSAGYFAFGPTVERAISTSNQEGIATAKVSKSRQGDHALLTLAHDATVAHQASLSAMTGTGFTLSFATAAAAGYMTILAIGGGALTSATSDQVTISDGFSINLRSSRDFSEQVGISDGCVSVLADGLSVLGPDGYTMQMGPEKGVAQAMWPSEGQAQAMQGEIGATIALHAEEGAVDQG